MAQYWVSTPSFTCWVEVQQGIVTKTAPYLWRERGKRWKVFTMKLVQQHDDVRIEDLEGRVGASNGYEQHEIFMLPWVEMRGDSSGFDSRVVVLRLPKVHLQFRITPHGTDCYQIRCKHGDEPSWVLGHHRSIEECQWRVIDHIMYFKLYETGEWNAKEHSRLRDLEKKEV